MLPSLVLDEVEADHLVDRADAQLAVLLQRVEEDEAQQAGPDRVAERTEDLYAKQVGAAGVEEPVVDVENADGHDTPNAAKAVHLRDVERVVDLEARDELLRLRIDEAADDSDDGGGPERDVVARGGHRDHAGEDGVAEVVHVVVVE